MWMCCFRGYITESIVEGQRIRDYQSNTELSYARANAVADFCLDQRNGLSETKTEQLLTVNGKSWSNPVCQKDAFGIPYRKWMCRFPGGIKFCLKEDEMIEKITGLEEEQEYMKTQDRNVYLVPISTDEDVAELQIQDVRDRPILRAVMKAGAEILLTGDKDFFKVGIGKACDYDAS